MYAIKSMKSSIASSSSLSTSTVLSTRSDLQGPLTMNMDCVFVTSDILLINFALFIMAPVFNNAYSAGVRPYLDEQMSSEVALEKVTEPFYEFMMNQTRETDLSMFAAISGHDQLDPAKKVPCRH